MLAYVAPHRLCQRAKSKSLKIGESNASAMQAHCGCFSFVAKAACEKNAIFFLFAGRDRIYSTGAAPSLYLAQKRGSVIACVCS